jgi:hypothetical protein
LAAASYLNPDEAWVSLLAIPSSFRELYEMAGRLAHPPLFVLLVHFVKQVSQSEVALRMVPVLAGTAFPWFVYKWLGRAWSKESGFIALLLLEFAPPLVALSAQVRGYTLALLFFAAALYLLETAIECGSAARMAGFAAALYLGIYTEYSAAFFTAAAGVYALLRLREANSPRRVVATWAASQAGAVGLYALLYKLHVQPRLAQVQISGEFDIWLRELFPQPGAHPAAFMAAGTFHQFAYFFASHSMGAVGLMLFLAGIALLAIARQPLAPLLTVPFVLTCGAAFLRLHPYSYSRHSVLLALFIAPGVAVALDWLAGSRRLPILAAALLLLPLWHYSALHDPGNMPPNAQRKESMQAALDYLRSSLPRDAPLLTDTETRQILGHYLAGMEWLPETNYLPSEERLKDLRVFATRWSYNHLDELRQDIESYRQRYRPAQGRQIWVMDAGFTANLMPQLTAQAQRDFGITQIRPFGEGIVLFQVRSGE